MNDAIPVAVIGLGNMGRHYAARLLAAGYRVTVWNRTPEKMPPLVSAGAIGAMSAADAVAASFLVISALEHAEAFAATLLSSASLEALTASHLIVDMSTVAPDAARLASQRLRMRGARYLDAPVSGGTRGAAAGTLTLLLGGDEADVLFARPVLEVLGKLHHVGPVGAGQTAKLVNQVIVAGTIGAVAEGLVLAERAGLDLARLLDALQGGFAESRVLREHGERMIRRNFVAGASNRVFLKDLNAIHALASHYELKLPLAEQLRDGYEELVDSGYAEEDHSGFWRQVIKMTDRQK
jgi:2-hydroxy-3-oxopropionate reductase